MPSKLDKEDAKKKLYQAINFIDSDKEEDMETAFHLLAAVIDEVDIELYRIKEHWLMHSLKTVI